MKTRSTPALPTMLVLLAAILRRRPGQGRLGVALLACLAVLATAACGGAEEEAAPAETGVALKLGYSDWPGWVAWEIAKEKGFFEKNGVAVELVWMDYVASMEAFAAGALDAVAMTNGDALVS